LATKISGPYTYYSEMGGWVLTSDFQKLQWWDYFGEHDIVAPGFVVIDNRQYSIEAVRKLSWYASLPSFVKPRLKSNKRKSIQELLDVATDIELMVYQWLVDRDIVFEFQSQLINGGERQLGDATVDFNLLESRILIRCQGLYFHTGAEVEAKDKFQRISLENMGYVVIDLYEDDIHDRLDTAMEKAVIGEELPH
jgi:very-short-patch-repair endonuclease